MIRYILIVFMCCFSFTLSADEKLDQHSQEALTKTQDLLTNSEKRQNAIQATPEAQKAHDFVKKITGDSPHLTDEVYKLASEIMATLVKDANGDVTKMQENLNKFARDPASFTTNWTPEQKQKLKELSQKLPQPILKD